MNRTLIRSLCLLMVSVLMTTGCAYFSQKKTVDDPYTFEPLLFNRPYDVTFLRTMEALNTVPGWVLESTDKEKGLIVLRNTQYGHLFDRDKGLARFFVKHVNRQQTSVELDPESQHMDYGQELLDQIQRVMEATEKKVSVQQVPVG